MKVLCPEKPRPRWMCGNATLTIVLSSTTMSWDVRMTNRNRDGLARRRPKFGEPPAGGGELKTRRGSLSEVRGIDIDLSAGNLSKRKLPPISIRRVPPLCNSTLKFETVKQVTSLQRTPAGDELSVEEVVDETARPMRADARRNNERLLEAARTVFAKYGGEASMEAIAREAGVGVGTLYRHFPKRIDVVEAVYRTDVDELAATAEQAVRELEPLEGLVTWLRAFLRYARGKRTFLNELHEAFEKNPELKVSARERIDQAAELVLHNAQEAGSVRSDLDGPDLMQLIGPMCTSATLSQDQGERLLAMILDGLRQPS